MATVVEQPRATETPRHYPGIDGLRGFALAGMLCYHGEFGWAHGAFLSVSTFFTLSGFLITTLLLREHSRSSRIDFRRFWSRRARRLLPAALFTLAAILVFHSAFSGLETAHLRGEVIAGVGYVENWWLIYNHRAYGAVFTAPSPVQHFWTLAIEEQFYLFFPLLFVGVQRLFHLRSRAAAAFSVLAAASLAWGAYLAHTGDGITAYYSTLSRAAELLFGVILAYALARVDLARVGAGRALDLGGAIGVVGLLLLWWRADLHDTWVFPFGIAANGIFTALIIMACLARRKTAAAIAIGPLRGLGIISYGVYLIHWPVFLWLDQNRLPLNTYLLFAVQVALTVAIAMVMFVVFESPVRHGTRLRGGSFAPTMIAAMAAIVIGALIVPEATGVAIDVNNPPSIASQRSEIDLAQPAPGMQRVIVVGDSMAWSVWAGLHEWGPQHGTDVKLYTVVGCGIGGEGKIRYLGLVRTTKPECATWTGDIVNAAKQYKPDAVLIVIGLADVSPRQFPDGYRNIGDAEFDARLSERVRKLTAAITATGARAVWSTFPHVRVKPEADSTGNPPFPENDPARIDKLNALIRQSVTGMKGTQIVDFASYARSQPGGEFNEQFRPDGVHLGAVSTKKAASWFGPQLVNRP